LVCNNIHRHAIGHGDRDFALSLVMSSDCLADFSTSHSSNEISRLRPQASMSQTAVLKKVSESNISCAFSLLLKVFWCLYLEDTSNIYIYIYMYIRI
jgi:hypothetical protein